jgi:ABC-type amino acid transport system permease subunit
VTVPKEKQPGVFAIYGTVGGLAATSGPLIGGVLVQLNIVGLDWRPIFLINVPVGLLGLYFGARHISESKGPADTRLDLVGVLLATVGLLLLLYPLTEGRDLHWPAWCYASMALAVPVLALFAWFERRKAAAQGSPLVPPQLFRARSFVAGQGLQLAIFLFTGAFFLAWYLFMQIGLNWTPLHAGLTALAFCLGAFISSALSVTALVPKFGRAVLQFGAIVLLAGLGAFLAVVEARGARIGTWDMAGPLLVIGIGFGAVASPIPMFALADVRHEDAGSASGLINTMQQLGLTLGIALVSVVFLTPLGGYANITPGPRGQAESAAAAAAFASAFKPALIASLAVIALTFAVSYGLPRRVAGHGPAAQPEPAAAG